MKNKILAILLVTFVSLGLLAACGYDSAPPGYTARANMSFDAAPVMDLMAPEAEMMMFEVEEDFGMWAVYSDDLQTLTPEMPVLPGAPGIDSAPPNETGGGDGFAEKIIYTANADIETMDFDLTIEAIYKMIAANNAFIESSHVGGRNHWQARSDMFSYRTAWFTIRVPQERLMPMTEGLDALGNVISRSRFAENITAQFVDTEARLTTLRIQEERLLVMLTRADEVADMIVIENSLAEVRYRIESIESTLRNWQNRIRFSTLHLHVMEVHDYTILTPDETPYWQQVWEGLKNTFSNIGSFFANLLKWFIVNLPILILLFVIGFIVTIIIIKSARKSARKRKEQYNAYSHNAQPHNAYPQYNYNVPPHNVQPYNAQPPMQTQTPPSAAPTPEQQTNNDVK